MPSQFGSCVVANQLVDTVRRDGSAKNSGRMAIGVEIEEKYCEMAAERMHQMTLGIAV
jgi:hypothetical protein